jgi:hypothetical protein
MCCVTFQSSCSNFLTFGLYPSSIFLSLKNHYVSKDGSSRCSRLGSNRVGVSPLILPEDEVRSILRNVVIFKVLRFLRLKRNEMIDKIQNKESSKLTVFDHWFHGTTQFSSTTDSTAPRSSVRPLIPRHYAVQWLASRMTTQGREQIAVVTSHELCAGWCNFNVA